VEITYDAAKNARNVEERGLSFELVHAFDFQTALFVVDDRKEYGEVRYRGLGLIGERTRAGLHRNPQGHPGHQLPQGQQKRGQKL